MAVNTDKTLQHQLIYSVFVRNHTPEGTFRALERDLDRLSALGTDIVWLMPIHPVGEVGRKGTLGSPYAIRDYRGVNPKYGTVEDFRHLVDAIHVRGMKCIIDVVYNHTSPDSVLAQTHPEWFFRDEQGRLSRHVADWWDVVDLDYTHKELWRYQIDTLKMWAEIVDGFRCDVASSVPLDFWTAARQGGGGCPPRLHLAGGERTRCPCAGSAAAGCLLRHGYGVVPGLRHDLRLRYLAVV
ncbi:MAG: alpha-amylase family glycosyl hydrolase [Lachnospiraceae bacterium]